MKGKSRAAGKVIAITTKEQEGSGVQLKTNVASHAHRSMVDVIANCVVGLMKRRLRVSEPKMITNI